MNFEYPDHIESAIVQTGWDIKPNKPPITDDFSSIIANFPKTRYYGSKRRLLGWIYHALKDLPFNNVLDGLGGTASVSLLFKAMGKEVSFHDGLLCNTIAAQALLANAFPFADINEAHFFIDQIKPKNGFISKTFSGMYFTDIENCWLDGAATAIHQIADPIKKSVYLYCLFQACLIKRPFNLFHRANLNLRLNKAVSRSFGNWVTWERPFSTLMKNSLLEIQSAIKPTNQSIHVLPPGDVNRLDAGYDLVYLDPPYVSNSKSGDDYLRRYHFLEGLSIYNDWIANINADSPIRSLNQIPHINAWQNKREFRDLLFCFITKHSQSIVVLSYVAGAYPSEDDIAEFFERIFRYVKILRKDFCHALAKEKKVELLFIGRNK